MDARTKKTGIGIPVGNSLAAIQCFSSNSLKLFASLLKILIQSRKATPISNFTPYKEVVVLGNGPSAKEFLESKQDFLQQKALLSVNFFAKHEFFSRLKPSFYVLADPAFFMKDEAAQILSILSDTVNWDLLLMIPNYAKKQPLWHEKKALLARNSFIKIAYYNMTKVEGFDWFVQQATMKGWGLPAPRNVLVPSIANCMRMGFDTIYLAGADHSWIKQIWVNDNNEVILDDKHSYDTGAKTVSKANAPLYLIVGSFSIALKSYAKINQLAKYKNVRIYNITPGSYIDVFERLKI